MIVNHALARARFKTRVRQDARYAALADLAAIVVMIALCASLLWFVPENGQGPRAARPPQADQR